MKALILKFIQTIFESIFPMHSERRLSIDFHRILSAMGENSEHENILKPYEKNICNSRCSILGAPQKKRKVLRAGSRGGAGGESNGADPAADADTPIVDNLNRLIKSCLINLL